IRDFHVTGVQTCALPISIRKTVCQVCRSNGGCTNHYVKWNTRRTWDHSVYGKSCRKYAWPDKTRIWTCPFSDKTWIECRRSFIEIGRASSREGGLVSASC